MSKLLQSEDHPLDSDPTVASVKLNPAFLSQDALYGSVETDRALPEIGWRLAPTPFSLSQEQATFLRQLGPLLYRWMQACEWLYQESLKTQNGNGRVPSWIATLLNQGKPEGLQKYAQMKRFRKLGSQVLRPDLLITEQGFSLCEVDAVPGGLGFTSALNEAYRKSGFSVQEASETLPGAFLRMLKSSVPGCENPVIVVVLSDEAQDYRREMQWLVNTISKQYPLFFLAHPKELSLLRERLIYTAPDGVEHPIDLIYRFFELFDLPNIPKMELIQYAIKKGWVHCTPPFKPQLEEKLWMALIHHPVLKPFWLEALGSGSSAEADLDTLQALIPHSWILDPTPLPFQAVIPGLILNKEPVSSFEALLPLSQKERQLVMKPSGFSPLAWGSRGVTIGHDVSQVVWQERVQQALSQFSQTPFLLQRFEKPKALNWQVFQSSRFENIEDISLRVRLCPYYFVETALNEPKIEWVGTLATACPADKKLIHGMKDAILAPVHVRAVF